MIVAHGLNVLPGSMLSIVHWFNNQGCDAVLVRFSGHYENPRNTAAITIEAWQQDIVNGYESAREISKQYQVPLFFVGYSLGGLLGIDLLLAKGNAISISKQVLLAPAIAIRDTASIVKLLFWWKSLHLPSLTPAKYRANERLSINAYKTMFGIVSSIQNSKDRLSIPTLAVIDTLDELISTRKLVHFLDRSLNGSYELLRLESSMKNRDGGYHHLIISEETMGESNWQLFTEKMKGFLFGS